MTDSGMANQAACMVVGLIADSSNKIMGPLGMRRESSQLANSFSHKFW